MKLLFITSSLECGRDGVGDYARSLGRECARLGHPCAWLALNDRHLPGSEERVAEGGDVLRLPAAAPWAGRVERAAAFVAETSPDWVSLQFVPHGFHPKGMVARLPGRLGKIIGPRRLHMMMHELWVGGSLKNRLIGAAQRFLVIRLLRMCRPSVIHATLPVNVEALAGAGFRAEVLPLFSNMPVAPMEGAESLAEEIRAGGAWCGGFFGAFYPEWQPEPLFGMLIGEAARRGRPLRLVSIGRLGAEGGRRWEELVRGYAGRIDFVRLGEQPPGKISQSLQCLDFGVPSASWRLIGKSSAAAAMLDHGLPLLVLPDSSSGFSGAPATASDPALLIRCDAELPAKLAAGLPRHPPVASAGRVAATFLARLGDAREMDKGGRNP